MWYFLRCGCNKLYTCTISSLTYRHTRITSLYSHLQPFTPSPLHIPIPHSYLLLSHSFPPFSHPSHSSPPLSHHTHSLPALIQHTPIPNPLTPHTLTHPISPSHLPHPFTLHSFSLILFSATKTPIKKKNPEYSYNTFVCNTESDTYHSQPAPSKESPYMCNTYYSHQHATPTSIGT